MKIIWNYMKKFKRDAFYYNGVVLLTMIETTLMARTFNVNF